MAVSEYKYVHCGAFGHAWYEYDGSQWTPEFGLPQVVRCERCGSERRDSINRMGQIEARSYDHPSDYKLGSARPTRAEFRLTAWERKHPEEVAKRYRAVDDLAKRRRKKAS